MKLDFDTALFFALVIGCMTFWYFRYVKPFDEARGQIIECMAGDRSPEAYENCVAELRP